MAKKSRRARKRARPQATPSTSQVVEPRVAPRDASAGALSDQGQLQDLPDSQEYRYVVDDLKRVAILAAAMFALLIALSFFIR